MQHKLKKTPDEVLETAVEMVKYASKKFRLFNGLLKMHVEQIYRF